MTALSQVLRKIDADEVVELTRSLVRIPSVYRPGDPESTEARVADFVEAWLRREGFQIETQTVAPGRPNVVGWLGEKRPGQKSLLLEGHTDVVTEGDPAAWSYPPFGAELVDGRIYGRGAADMKSGLAAAMVAAAAFRRAGVGLRGKLVVGALVDEEDGMIGVRHLCGTAVGRELDAAIICEPEENELCLEQRGVVWARFRLRGKMAHGAMPEAGVNPIAGLGRLLAAAPALERRLRKACEKSRHLKPPTVTPTIIQGPPPKVGVPQSNVIPATAETTFDIRLTPGITADGIHAELEEVCRAAAAGQPGLKVEWEPVNAFRLATRVDASEALVQAMIRGVKQATKHAPRYGGVPGSTDGTILRMELGIPIVTCGPGDRLIPHQVDEFVSEEQVVEAARIYAASVLNYLEPE
ncbi:MAG TPA: M20 family metallopeptidase [Candidatus Bathyarchaeia archaeon]|nr:M20 family metallopeptidase [Candidatus Bathyarchaeia archaeon]